MANEIKLYWWRGKDAKSINLGDEINQYIVGYVSGRPVRRTPVRHAELLAIGSVLQFPQNQGVVADRELPYQVWGSGTLLAGDIEFQEKFELSAIRGPLSHSLMGYKGTPQFGDPGILASLVWEPAKEKQHAWGIIPHHSQLQSPWVQRLLRSTRNSVLIDVTDPDIEGSMKKISACDHIASTSLHGLVLADAYRIPNVWLWEGPLHRGGSWKFLDYFAGIQRHLSEFVPTKGVTALSAIDLSAMSFGHFDLVESYAKRLVKSFPL